MKNLLRFIAFVLMVGSAHAQSNLPACQGTNTLLWNFCNGTATWPNGDRYIGDWQNGQANGQGTQIYGDGQFKGATYIGQFRNNKYSGQGTYTDANSHKLVGEFKDGKLNGQGTFTKPDGTKYIGEFKDGEYNGQGTFTDSNGNKTVGEFKNNKRHGQGTYTSASGIRYVGEFKDDKAHGLGTMFASNGSVINQGIWADDKFVQSAPVQQASAINQTVASVVQPYDISKSNLPACRPLTYIHDCIGTFTTPSGEQYVGEFRYSLYDGQGTLTYADGNKFVGWFKAGKYFGQGTLFAANGTVISQGIWVDGKFVQSAPAQQASVANQTVPAVVLQPDNSERDRLAAEVQAERKKRQELEEQLRVAQQATQPNKQSVTSGIERRVALVIGNSTYRASPLDNPANDATDITNALNKVGFRTTLIRNATLGQMRDATRKFAEQLQSADVALIYFAGHGIESNRKNYMIPVNADLKFEYELTDQAYDAGSWLEMLETIKSSNSERVNIVILDACRNNNLIGSRSLGRGLGRMDAPTGTFLSYSTAPGKVAADGAKGQRNSPFTRHLLSVIQQPGLQIEEAFKEVRRNVSRDTNGTQVPWESTSLVGKFYFTAQR